MRLVVIGTELPGRTFCEPDGTPLSNVHVGVRLGTNPDQLVRGDTSETRWELEIRVVVSEDGALDFRGAGRAGQTR